MPQPQIQPCPEGAWDVLELVHEIDAEDFDDASDLDDRNAVLTVSAEWIPATLERINEALDAEERAPLELRDIVEKDGVERQLAGRTIMGLARRALKSGALALIPIPRDDVAADQVELRAAGLELVERWFVRALKNRLGSVAIKNVPDLETFRERVNVRKRNANLEATDEKEAIPPYARSPWRK